MPIRDIQQWINDREPRWVGLNLLAPTYRNSVAILQGVDPSIQVMLGGHQAKAQPERILEDNRIPRVDALILGEAETRVCEILADARAVEWLPNTKARGAPRRLAPLGKQGRDYWLAPPIDELPRLDRSFLPNDPFLADDGRWEANLVGSRGCPFDCSFCGAAVSANRDVTVRVRDPYKICEEMDHLATTLGCSAFRFVDDLFLVSQKKLEEFLQAIQEFPALQNVRWDATGRINVIEKLPQQLIQNLKRSGLREVALGIESGSDRLLSYIDKKLTQAQILSAAEKLLKEGVNIKGYFIFGLPTESSLEIQLTRELIDALWRLADRCVGDFRCSAFEFRPYPGTPEWSRLIQSGKFTEEQLLAYDHADIPAGTERTQFNFTTGLKFSEAEPDEIRRHVGEVMSKQWERKTQTPGAFFGSA